MNSLKLSVVAAKDRLRKKIKNLKISASVCKSRSLRLSSKVANSHFFENSNTIGLYSALSDEINVSPIAQTALDLGKRVFFPRVSGRKMSFYEVCELKKDLKPGKYKILEPVLSRTKKRVQALDLILVPGRAFDKKGKRLGRGAGYYDRLLQKWSDSVRMGVAFREQLVKVVPSEPHDIDMDVVLTA